MVSTDTACIKWIERLLGDLCKGRNNPLYLATYLAQNEGRSLITSILIGLKQEICHLNTLVIMRGQAKNAYPRMKILAGLRKPTLRHASCTAQVSSKLPFVITPVKVPFDAEPTPGG